MTERNTDFFFSPLPSANQRRWHANLAAGIAHGSLIGPLDPLPGQPVALYFATNAALPIDRVAVYYTINGDEPRGAHGSASSGVVALAEPAAAPAVLDPGAASAARYWRALIPGQPEGTLVQYRADGWQVAAPFGHWDADALDPVGIPPDDGGRLFAYNVDHFAPPAWLADAVIYQIFPDRFATGIAEPPLRDPGSIMGIFGGTLRGVQERLDYIQALGATCIWLNPVVESPDAHGYSAADFFHVAQRLGGDASLLALVDEAHRRQMRVLLDFAPNHVSNQNALFRQALADPSSAAARWFAIGDEWPEGYACYAHVKTMPELATERVEVRRYLVDVALHWLNAYGVDGLRLDYVPGPAHAFWTFLQRGIKLRNPEAVTIGEITAPLSDIATYSGRMDA